jgi:hypothetical protein
MVEGIKASSARVLELALDAEKVEAIKQCRQIPFIISFYWCMKCTALGEKARKTVI